jgi:hypothetical protein
MMREPENEDGQLYTLGLLERLREQTGLIQGTYADLYRIVDKLLREIENPNLHDIANLNYRVELWDRYALHIRWVMAAAGHIDLARAAFDAAVREFPNERLTLRNGIMVIQDHDPALRKSH